MQIRVTSCIAFQAHGSLELFAERRRQVHLVKVARPPGQPLTGSPLTAIEPLLFEAFYEDSFANAVPRAYLACERFRVEDSASATNTPGTSSDSHRAAAAKIILDVVSACPSQERSNHEIHTKWTCGTLCALSGPRSTSLGARWTGHSSRHALARWDTRPILAVSPNFSANLAPEGEELRATLMLQLSGAEQNGPCNIAEHNAPIEGCELPPMLQLLVRCQRPAPCIQTNF